MLLAVLATKEPLTSRLAFSPKKIPFGLIKNKFASPKTPNLPNNVEGLFPVTRLKMFLISAGLAKLASLPSPILNSWKL